MKTIGLKIIAIVLVLLALGLGLWLVNQNVPYYGNLIVNLDLARDQPMISKLGPAVRTIIQNDYLAILESPVYFDLRSLPWFKTARIYLTFKSQGATLAGLAGQVGPAWQYHLLEPLVVMDLSDGWQKAVFDFDLRKLYRQKNVRRFLLSTSHQEDGQLLVKDLTIILEQ